MANDFSADPNCLAVYRFEVSALDTDSKGSNTLSEYNSPGAGSFVDEGGGSTNTGGVSCYYITDAALASNFPLKSGTSNKTISVFARVRPSFTNTGNSPVVMAKQNNITGSHRTITCAVQDVTSSMFAQLRIGSSTGGYFETVAHGTSIPNNTYSRITWSYRDSDKFYAIRVRDTSGNVVGTDKTGTSGTDGIALFSQSDFIIGGRQAFITPPDTFWLGHLDEVVIFNKVLTATDATNLANGTYSGTGDSGGQTITATGGSYSQSGTSMTLRVGSPLYLRYRK